jgi:hypothetical protein
LMGGGARARLANRCGRERPENAEDAERGAECAESNARLRTGLCASALARLFVLSGSHLAVSGRQKVLDLRP